jgi:predicted transglutaminase-like cysteine proteinase
MHMKRLACAVLMAAALAFAGGNYSARAAFFSLPRAIQLQLQMIHFEMPTLAPIAYSRFCVQYPDDCQVRRMAFRRPHPMVLTAARLKDLIEINRDVNGEIIPEADGGSVVDERWRILPHSGACHDYAVTKRHELLARGWASRSLLLAEVVVPWGEHHLVLVARTDQGDLVLDNLAAGIRTWSSTPYHWVRIQSPSDPNNWMTIATSPAAVGNIQSLSGPATTLRKRQAESRAG